MKVGIRATLRRLVLPVGSAVLLLGSFSLPAAAIQEVVKDVTSSGGVRTSDTKSDGPRVKFRSGDQSQKIGRVATQKVDAFEESDVYAISFQNVGTTTWTTDDGYLLRNAQSGNAFDLDHCDGLEPGEVCTWEIFIVDVGPPSNFHADYHMEHDGDSFGDHIKVKFKVS